MKNLYVVGSVPGRMIPYQGDLETLADGTIWIADLNKLVEAVRHAGFDVGCVEPPVVGLIYADQETVAERSRLHRAGDEPVVSAVAKVGISSHDGNAYITYAHGCPITPWCA